MRQVPPDEPRSSTPQPLRIPALKNRRQPGHCRSPALIAAKLNPVASKWSCPVFVAHRLTASVEVVGPVDKWSGAERLSTCPQGAGGSRRSESRGLPGLGFDRVSVALVSGEASGSVEDGEGAVRVLVDPDVCLDVVGPVGSGGDLEGSLAVAHGVVVCDGALCMQAEDVVDLVGPGEGDEGAVVELGGDREAAVVIGQVGPGDEAVGGRDRRDPG